MPDRLHKKPSRRGLPDASVQPVIRGKNLADVKAGATNRYTALTDEERGAIVQKAASARLAEARKR